MNDRMRWFVTQTCSLASLSYAAGWKRVGHGYFVALVAALYISADGACIVYGGRMPSRINAPIRCALSVGSRSPWSTARFRRIQAAGYTL